MSETKKLMDLGLDDEMLAGIGRVHVLFGILELKLEHLYLSLAGMSTSLRQPGPIILAEMPIFKKVKTIRNLSVFGIRDYDSDLHERIKDGMNTVDKAINERKVLAHARWGKLSGESLQEEFDQDSTLAMTLSVSAKKGAEIKAIKYDFKNLRNIAIFIQDAVSEIDEIIHAVQEHVRARRS